MSNTMRALMGLMSLLLIAPAWAQSVERADPAEQAHRPIGQRMGDLVDPVVIEGVSARRAFEWWSQTTGIPLVVNWETLAAQGVNPDTPISLNLRYVPAGHLLGMMMKMLSTEFAPTLLYETTPWYVQVLTKQMANQQVVLRVYDVRDLLHEVPTFDDVPTMNLRDALSNTNSGGGGSSGGAAQSTTGLFDRIDDSEPKKTKGEHGQDLADLIRETIEPDIWQANGGQYASVRYFHGRLIVNASLYVHEQIGMPEVSSTTRRSDTVRSTTTQRSQWRATQPHSPRRTPDGVAGVNAGR